MVNKFVSWLDSIPANLKKFFTNPVVDNVITDGLGVASILDPALAPLFGGISAAVVKAEALAAAANVQSGSGAQKFALVMADSQQVFNAYEVSTGTKIETTQQTTIVNAIVAMLNNIPAATVAVPVSVTPVTNGTVNGVPTGVASVQAAGNVL